MDQTKLVNLGLTPAESTIYTAILSRGECTVKDISKACGFHRTNIYDILEQLKEKGLVTYLQEGKVMKFSCADPSNLYDFLQEKKELLDEIYPELSKLHGLSKDSTFVQVFKGMEGMKTAWRDMIKVAKPIYGYGVRGQLREKLPVFAMQWIRDAKEKKIPYYGIYTDRKKKPDYVTDIRFVSEELNSPVATFIYDDKVNINIWEPELIAIVIKSKIVAHTYKQHFDLLWKIAKK